MAAALISLAACAEALAPDVSVWTIALQRHTQEAYLRGEPDVTVEDGVVRVRGVIETPSVCDEVFASAAATGQGVTIQVRSVSHRGGCLTIGGRHQFVATGSPPPGTYRVVVEVVVEDRTAHVSRVLDTQVSVH